MWPFTKYYSILDSGFLEGATDWHCHILPGVDDGIRTMESALEVLAYYEEIGIREVWLTPHLMEDVPNTPAALRARFAEFKAAYPEINWKDGKTLNQATQDEIKAWVESIGL